MAIAVASVQNTGYSSVSAVVITKPTGLAVGNLLVCFIHINGNATIITPSGWTQGTPQTAGAAQSLNYLYKIANSTDAAATNFSFTLSTTIQAGGGLLRVTGTAGSNILGASDQDTNTNSSPSSFAGGLTPAQANSLIIMGIGANDAQQNGSINTYFITTDNPTWTEAWQFERNLTDGNNFVTSLAYAVRTQTTATGAYGASAGGYNNGGSDWTGILLSINPAIDVTVNADLLTVTITPKDPVVTGGATVNADVLTVNVTPVNPTSAGQAKWSNPTEHTSIWTNQNES